MPSKAHPALVRHSICSICNATSNCGIDAYVQSGVLTAVRGTKENPHNQGRICGKGARLAEYVYHRDRLRTPLLRKGPRGSDHFEPISWDQALDIIARRLLAIKDQHNPESVIFYVGYPKWQRPFVKRLAHNFGSPNYCSESSTCFSAMYFAFILNYGRFAPPDIKGTKCLLAWSNNPFHSNAPQAAKIINRRRQGMSLIEVGPMITPMTRHADIHLRLRPGTSGALALAMANVIIRNNLYDRDFIENWTNGFEAFAQYAAEFSLDKAESITGVPADHISKAAHLYATSKPAALMPGASATVHHTNGLQNSRAIFSLIGLTGNLDVPGGNRIIPHSFLEVSRSLPTTELSYSQPVPYEQMPPRLGLNKYPVWKYKHQAQATELPFALQTNQPYPIKAMLAFGLNYRMWPGSNSFKQLLSNLDFLVDIDIFMTDSARLADVVLPACTSLEREELKVYPGNHLFFSEPAIDPIGDSRPDVDIVADLARRLTPEDDLLIAGYRAGIDHMLAPMEITVGDIIGKPEGIVPEKAIPNPPRAYEREGFNTPSGKMEFVSIELHKYGFDPLPVYREPIQSPLSTPQLALQYPLVLTTGTRIPEYVHSRTFRLEWVQRKRPKFQIDINPIDAKAREISQDDTVELSTSRGAIQIAANLTDNVPQGVVSIYHSFPGADVNTIIEPDYLDPISGFPGFKSLLGQIRRV